MIRITRLLLLYIIAGLLNIYGLHAQTIKIMPMGNSITYDDNSYDVTNPRPAGDRISYRYRLYQLLKEAHYDFDYTGSENSGINYFQDPEYDDNAGFPGITDAQLAYLINTGYNLRYSRWVTNGPYFNYYHPDIILLHIGTNGLDPDPSDVEDILDNIRTYEPDVIILVARIINRATYSSLTTLFNDNVQSMVAARHDSKIISVNMETGAGINYSVDMSDNLHPNVNGYNKMAAKWFQALDNLNKAPVVSDIPVQYTFEDTTFPLLDLNDFVSDVEDSAEFMEWSYKKQPGSKLDVTIETGHILRVVCDTPNWHGTEMIRLYAKDRGNGAFRKSDSTDVQFTVVPVNDPPSFTSTPVFTGTQDQEYTYQITVSDIDTGDVLSISVPQKPEWLAFDPQSGVLSGTPGNANIGVNYITAQVSDGKTTTDQSFELYVSNVNDPPFFTSEPILTATVREPYLYLVTAGDMDPGDIITFDVPAIPAWLNFIPGVSSAYLINTPSVDDVGSYDIVLRITDGISEAIQEFTLIVRDVSSLGDEREHIIQKIYPVPAKDRIEFSFVKNTSATIYLYDLSGAVIFQSSNLHGNNLEMDISSLPAGIYIYKACQDQVTSFGKISKY